MTSRRRMEDSDHWCAVGRIEAGRSITDVALFFGVHHSEISRLWKQFQTTQTIVRRPVADRPRVTIPAEDRYAAVLAKRNSRAISTQGASMVTAFMWRYLQQLYAEDYAWVNYTPEYHCVFLSVQWKALRSKWSRKCVNWTVWLGAMSCFLMSQDLFWSQMTSVQEYGMNKEHAMSRKTSPNITHSEAEALWCAQGLQ